MKMINKFFLFILFFCFLDVKSQCNGSFQLCDKKYNEVAILTTHNAFNSSEDNFQFPNQTYNILNQLNKYYTLALKEEVNKLDNHGNIFKNLDASTP